MSVLINFMFVFFSSGIGEDSYYCAVFLLYCWLAGHKPIWNQFLISLAESSPDSILGVTYISEDTSLGEECPQNPEALTFFSLVAWDNPLLEVVLKMRL